jgi:RNA polymerase sigma-70 factor (ECF subfamily)
MSREFSKYSEERLLELIKGEKKKADLAFTELYNRYSSRIYSFTRTFLNDLDKANDVFQETFIKFYDYARKGNDIKNAIGLLMTIARNQSLNAIREKEKVKLEEVEYIPQKESSYEQKEYLELVMISIDLLEEETKQVFIMRVFNDLSYEEIADITKMPASRARYLVFSARNKLKSLLAPYYEEKKLTKINDEK